MVTQLPRGGGDAITEPAGIPACASHVPNPEALAPRLCTILSTGVAPFRGSFPCDDDVSAPLSCVVVAIRAPGDRGIPFRHIRCVATFPMAAAASISAVTASFTTLSLQHKSQPTSSTSVVALPAFHGLKATAVSDGSLHARVASQCVVASSSVSCRGVVTMGPLEAGVGMMGTKMGMMTVFTPDGKAVPCTVVGFHEGNIVTQVKSDATDGYTAVQVGYRRVRDRKLTKPELGHLKKVDAIPMRHLQEFRVMSTDGYEPNQRLELEEIFKEGDLIDVVGNSIGKGFQG